jgi:hypothetical protein
MMTLLFFTGVAMGYALLWLDNRHLRRELADARAESEWRGELLKQANRELAALKAGRLCECHADRGNDGDDSLPLHLLPSQWDGEEDYGEGGDTAGA